LESVIVFAEPENGLHRSASGSGQFEISHFVAGRRLMGEASRFDDAIGHRQTSRTPGGDAGPEIAANLSGTANLLGFAALTASLRPQ
jgi:hypothetical protein